MARKKDLGGLAALAGLAYIANRDKAAKSGEGPTPFTPTASNTGGESIEAGSGTNTPDLGEIRDEAGTVSKLRRNTEDGSLYDPTGSNMSTATRKPAAPAAKRPAGGIANARDELLKRQGRPRDPRDAEMGMSRGTQRSTDDTINPRVKQYRDDTYNPDVKQYRDDTYNPRVRRGMNKENLDATGETFKKGGSVKGWGISRGARKAKIY